MDTNKTETIDTDLEAEETLEDTVSETSEDAQESSKDTTEKDDQQGENKEKESTEGKKEEESYEDKVNRIAQSIAQKSIKTYLQKDQTQTKHIAELESQVNELSFNRDIEAYYGEESENKSEAEAEKNRKAREHVKSLVIEYQKNASKVNHASKMLGDADVETFLKNNPLYESQPNLTVNQVIDYLDTVQRSQMAREAVWRIVFPEDAPKLQKIASYLKEFSNAHDKEDFEIIVETIKARHGAGEKRYKPPESRNESSGIDIKGMSAEEKIKLGLEQERKKYGG